MTSLFTGSLPSSGVLAGKRGVRKSWEKYWPELLLLTISGLLYFWNLPVNGWGNPYYAAAAQAGALDWEALIFGSADAGNGLSVDKPPLHLWIMAASVKLFGLNSLSVLAPQALMGMTTAWLLQRSVMTWGSRSKAFLAGLFVVLTPVTSIVFRFNNPDALLLLLWTLTVFLVLKSVERRSAGLLYLAAFMLGVAFLCKQFQSWILVPAVLAAFLLFGFDLLRARLRRVIISASIMALPATAWILAIELTPPSQRPWIGGSATNSSLELTFGYNGLGRLTGNTALGAVNPMGFQGVVGHDAGPLRLLTINYAPEVAWFLPLSFVGAGIMLVKLLRGRYGQPQSILAVLTTAWFVTTFVILSFMTGDIHPYYTSMIALPMAVLSAEAFHSLWTHRQMTFSLRSAALMLLVSVFVASGILTWFETWHRWPATAVKTAGVAIALVLLLPGLGGRPKIVMGALAAAAATVLLIPSLFVAESVATSQQGSFPISGPVPSAESWHRRDAEQLRLDERGKYALARGEPVVPRIADLVGNVPDNVRWAAATTGSENAALYQLSARRPVMAIGGFSARDSFPSLDVLQKYVADGELAYYIHQPGILDWSSSSNTLAVVSWIEDNYEFEDIDGVRLYDMARKVG